jgi:hypothetical protein
MAYKYAKGYPKGDFLLPSVTKIIGDCTDKTRVISQWSANMVVEWVKLNCAKSSGNFPHYKVNDEQLNQARFNFREISDEALQVGSAVHAAIEEYLLTGKEPKTDHPAIIAGYLAFIGWMDENRVEPIAIEEKVYGNCWAGTLDLRCLLNGKTYVIDFKTSKAIYADDYGPQIAAYRSTFKDVEGCGILRLDKETGLPEWKDFSNRYEKDLKIFNKMVELFMLRHKIIAKKAGWKED